MPFTTSRYNRIITENDKKTRKRAATAASKVDPRRFGIGRSRSIIELADDGTIYLAAELRVPCALRQGLEVQLMPETEKSEYEEVAWVAVPKGGGGVRYFNYATGKTADARNGQVSRDFHFKPEARLRVAEDAVVHLVRAPSCTRIFGSTDVCA